ncbi:hypothetical protein EON65_35755 [archaeon]|nr:MAG: hypothetical protein EON65_35755 [archaeon]
MVYGFYPDCYPLCIFCTYRWRAGQIVHFTFAFKQKQNPQEIEGDDGIDSEGEMKDEYNEGDMKDSKDCQAEASGSNATTPVVPVKAEKVILFPPGKLLIMILSLLAS